MSGVPDEHNGSSKLVQPDSIDTKVEDILSDLRHDISNNPDTPNYIFGRSDDLIFEKATQSILTLIAEATREARIDELKNLTKEVKCLRPNCLIYHTNFRKGYVEERLKELDKT